MPQRWQKRAAPFECAEELPTLDALAKTAGMSSYHFHRIFKAANGLTPKAYTMAQRSQRVREELSKRSTVTEAIYLWSRVQLE
jgi:AraC family transcriptional regulator of adaptative response/methylated-DNA-[protein]-cysteine methyltransferase